MKNTSSPPGRAKQLLRIMLSQSMSTYANQVIAFVIPWLILTKTGSAANAGAVAFAMGVSGLVGTLIGGVVTDRIGGRRVSMLADALSLLTALGLAAALWVDFFAIWFVVITQMIGVFFDGPGQIGKNAAIPAAAAEEKVPVERAMGIQQMIQGVAMFVGPISAGFLIALFSESATLAIAGALFMFAILWISKLKKDTFQHEHPMTRRQAYRDMREAFQFIRHDALLSKMQIFGPLYGALLFPLTVIIYPAWFVFSGQSSEALGVFLGASAIGGMIGGGLFAAFAPKVSKRAWISIATIVHALLLVTLSFMQPGSIATIVVGFLSGVVLTGVMAIIFTTFYTRTPQNLLGRVNSIGTATGHLLTAPAALIFGWIVTATSPQTALLTCAVVLLIIAISIALSSFAKLLDRKEETHVKQT